MKIINQFFMSDVAFTNSSKNISLCGKLEAIVGNYFVAGAGLPDSGIQTIYYDKMIDNNYECVELIKENIVAYFTADERYAFVLETMIDKFIKDTEEYHLVCIPVSSFEIEEFCIDDENDLPEFMENILWVDDDFMNDENIPFDFEKFEVIDSGVRYVNPRHFSVRDVVGAVVEGVKDCF